MLLRKVRVASQYPHSPQRTDPTPDPLNRLCETCNGAATRCLAILYALRLQAIIRQFPSFFASSPVVTAFPNCCLAKLVLPILS